jgi:hypothetical protein
MAPRMTPVRSYRCPTCHRPEQGRFLTPPWCRHLNTPHDAKKVCQMKQETTDDS